MNTSRLEQLKIDFRPIYNFIDVALADMEMDRTNINPSVMHLLRSLHTEAYKIKFNFQIDKLSNYDLIDLEFRRLYKISNEIVDKATESRRMPARWKNQVILINRRIESFNLHFQTNKAS